MSDLITLRGLTVRGFHGVFDFEKRAGQDFVIDVQVRTDVSAAAVGDDLAQTVDYGVLANRTAAIVAGEPFDLIESLASAIADDLLELCSDVTITVHKPQAPIDHAFADAAVTVHRTRAGNSSTIDTPGGFAVLSLGANIGEATDTLHSAVEALDRHPQITVLGSSAVYATAPWGGVEQDDFRNLTAIVATTLSARELLRVCQGIEVAGGRTREVHWGPRTLDIDLVRFTPTAATDVTQPDIAHSDDAATELHSAAAELRLPHPHAHERAFVLAPWRELRPQATIAVSGRGSVPIAELLTELGDQAVNPVAPSGEGGEP